MDRRRAAGLLLALAACFATATAAPTASNHTALDLYDGAPEGCYYNFQHYGEGDRIMTNEPCLNCTCHNRMLMCYLRVCPFTKPIGQDCTIEKRADQCCPIVTCPDVPVDLLTSTTTSPAEYGSTGVGKLDKYGCSINGKYFPEGSKVPPTPNKPCEHCYCIRNMTTCVMQECTLHVDGCTPIYHKDVCCPVRYSCDHPEDEMPLLDDLSTTVRPTPGFLLTTTTLSPVTQMSQDCVYENEIHPDGALIKTEKACDHCYCMKGDIVCVVQECGTPMENEGKNCTALAPREGVCCPDTYICEGDEPITGTYEPDYFTAQPEEVTTYSPPRRTGSEGSGYRNDDEVPYTESPVFEPSVEGSGDEETPQPSAAIPDSATTGLTEDILASTEEPHEYIPLTTSKPIEEIPERTTASQIHEKTTSIQDIEESSEKLPSATETTDKELEEPVTKQTIEEEIDSSDIPKEVTLKPLEAITAIPVTTSSPDVEEDLSTTKNVEQGIDHDSSESLIPSTKAPVEEEKVDEPKEEDLVTSAIVEETTITPHIDLATTATPVVDESDKTTIYDVESESEKEILRTTSTPEINVEIKETTEPSDTFSTSEIIKELNTEPQYFSPSTTSAPSLDDEYVTTETQEQEETTEGVKETEFLEPHHHVTASTPLLEEIEKDTTELGTIDSSAVTKEETSSAPSVDIAEKDSAEPSITEDILNENILTSTNIPVLDQHEMTTTRTDKTPESSENNVDETSEKDQYLPTTVGSSEEIGKATSQSDVELHKEEHTDSTLSTTSASIIESEAATTEPDKGLNTIPSGSIDEENVEPADVQKTTSGEEKLTTDSELDNKFNYDDSYTVSPKETTETSDTSASKDESLPLTTEPAFRKEDSKSPTESEIISEVTTVAAIVTVKDISPTVEEQTKSTESTSGIEQETATTTVPKSTEILEQTSELGASSTSSNELSTIEALSTDKPVSPDMAEAATTTPTLIEDLPETTSANLEDNEIFNEPRIPGEGSCLLNGVTYTNESAVPSTNKCQSGCKCISSIIKCDPIICSPPPEYMDNCQTTYDSIDSCCPTYICEHKTETIPPQSHSQMSGTEVPVISPVKCHGDECEISDDKKHIPEPSVPCTSESCVGQSDKGQETGLSPIEGDVSQQPSADQQESCIGDKCAPTSDVCTEENGCQASPVKPCEDGKCDITPEVVLPQEPQVCADGKDCNIVDIPTKDCSSGDCSIDEPAPEHIPTKEICNEEGCKTIPADSVSECKDENCRRKDSSALDQQISVQCVGPECKQSESEVELSITTESPSPLDFTQEDEKKSTVVITESPEKSETSSEQLLTTSPAQVEYETKSEATSAVEMELTTKRSEVNVQTDADSSETTPVPETPEIPTQTGIPIEDLMKSTEQPKMPVTDEINLQTDTPSMETELPDTELMTSKPQDTETQVTDKPDLIPDDETITKATEDGVTKPSKDEDVQNMTEPSEKTETESITSTLTEESSTAPADVTQTSEDVEKYVTVKEMIEEPSTKLPESYATEAQDETKLLGETDQEATSKTVIEETTEPTKMHTFESQDENTNDLPVTVTEPTKLATEPAKSHTYESHDENITDLPVDMATEPSMTDAEPIETHTSKSHDDSTADFEADTATESIIDTTEPQESSKSPEEISDSSRTPVTEIDTEPSILTSDGRRTTESLVTMGEESTTKKISTESDTSLTKSDDLQSPEIPTVTEISEPTQQEATTSKIADETGTELSIAQDISEIPEDITTLPEKDDVNDVTKTTTDSKFVTKSTDDYEHSEITTKQISEISTEPSKPQDMASQDLTTEITVENEKETTLSDSDAPEKITKSPENIEHDKTKIITSEPAATKPSETTESEEAFTEVIPAEDVTIKQLEDSSTEPEESYATSAPDTIKTPEEVDQEEITKISEEISTIMPLTDDKNIQVTKSPEDYETTKISEDGFIEPEKIPEEKGPTGILSESTEPSVTATESDEKHETSKPTLSETAANEPVEEEEKQAPEVATTPKEEELISETSERTTPTLISDSKITEPELVTPEITSTELPHGEEPQQPDKDEEKTTESTMKEKLSTTSLPEDHDIVVTTIPTISDLDSSPAQPETEKPDIIMETTASSMVGLEDVQKQTSHETLSTQEPEPVTVADKQVPDLTEIQSTPAAPSITDGEIKETISESQESMQEPADSESPHDSEIKTDSPMFSYKPEDDHSTEIPQESSTEEIALDTKQPVISENTDTEITTETVHEPEKDSDSKLTTQEDENTEQSLTKDDEHHSTLSQPTGEKATTQSSISEGLTEEPTIQDYEATKKPQDSVATSAYETTTAPTKSEVESQTEIGDIETSSDDKTQSPEADSDETEITTPSIEKLETTIKELDQKIAIDKLPTENVIPDKDEEPTQPPSVDEQVTIEPSTEKALSPEETEVPTEPAVHEHQDTTISNVPETTDAPVVDVKTETIIPEVYTDSGEFVTKEQPSIDMQKITTEATSITEMLDSKTTISESAMSVPEQAPTESAQDIITKAPEIEIHLDTEAAKEVTSSDTSIVTEGPEKHDQEPEPTTVSDEHVATPADHVVTEAPVPTTFSPELATTKSSEETKQPSEFESTTASKHEQPESTSGPLEVEVTDKSEEEKIVTVAAGEITTEKAGVSEADYEPQSPEVQQEEKHPDVIQTDSPVQAPVEEFTTPKIALEPEIYQTTSSPAEDKLEKSTLSPVPSEESTTSVQDVTVSAETPSHEEEPSIPVVIPETDKASTPEEAMTVQTERVTVASMKPTQETAAPEDESLLTTTKATTMKLEEAVTTSPAIDKTKAPERPAEIPVTTAPELPKPVSTEAQPTDEVPTPDEEAPFPTSGTSGYGQEPDYVEEDQTFGPGTCRYGGKVYVSAQQIPRDDPCDFCFCFRSDIICLQQSCPPPIHGCHEEPIQGFCCPRYECPVSMATTVNVTTTTTTTTTTLPPHFPTHPYKGSAQRRGCQIKGHTYKVGEVVRASSGPCLHCTCGGDGQMKCDPKACTPEPMLRQMIAAAVSSKRRR